MSRATTAAYPTIDTIGALLPSDLIARVATGDLDGMTSADYALPDGFSLRQAAARAWELLLPTYHSFRNRLDDLPIGVGADAIEQCGRDLHLEWMLGGELDELGRRRRAELQILGRDVPERSVGISPVLVDARVAGERRR